MGAWIIGGLVIISREGGWGLEDGRACRAMVTLLNRLSAYVSDYRTYISCDD